MNCSHKQKIIPKLFGNYLPILFLFLGFLFPPLSDTCQDVDLKAKDLYKACSLTLGGTGLRNGKMKQDFFL